MRLSKAAWLIAFAALAFLFLANLLEVAFPGADRAVPAVDYRSLPGIPEYDDRHPHPDDGHDEDDCDPPCRTLRNGAGTTRHMPDDPPPAAVD